jgi:DNA processing protein
MSSFSVLILFKIPKLKRKTIEKILKDYIEIPTSAFVLLDFFKELSKKDNSINVPSYEVIKLAISSAKEIIKKCSSSNICIMNYSENIFPQKLKNIPYPPLLLYYKGCSKYLSEKYCAAVVGTRTPTKRAKAISEKLGLIFASKGFTVASGLALGCDTFGHLGSLDKYGYNIAVLPCGLDNIYPHENSKLASKLIESGGCLISEYPPSTNPKPQYFILRDRLLSGLAEVIAVIEANLNSGTMHTAKFALEQKKILSCISPNLLEGTYPCNKGNLYLINNKVAISLKNFQDIEMLIEGILKNSIVPMFNLKRKEPLKYEQLKMNL